MTESNILRFVKKHEDDKYKRKYVYAYKDIGESHDLELTQLIDDIARYRNPYIEKRGIIVQFLKDSIFSGEHCTRRAFTKYEIWDSQILRAKVKVFINTDVYHLLDDLMKLRNRVHISYYDNYVLYNVLNILFPKEGRRRK